MKIVKITIKGESGYCCIDEAYKDKIVLTSNSITYHYKPNPMSNLEINQEHKWSYKTDSNKFKEIFDAIAEMTPYYLNSNEKIWANDVGVTIIIATFENKHSEKVLYCCPKEFFKDYYKLIKLLVPQTESIPNVLTTSDD